MTSKNAAILAKGDAGYEKALGLGIVHPLLGGIR